MLSKLVRPDLFHTWHARRVRAAARSGRLDDLALARIRDTGEFRRVRRPLPVIVLLAYSFAVISSAGAVAAARLAGAVWPAWPVLAGTALAMSGVGAVLFCRHRRPRRVALAAVGVQIAAHPAVVLAAQSLAHRRVGSITDQFAAALFCHSVGGAPSGAQVAAAGRAIGLHVPTVAPATIGGFLSPVASLAAAVLLAGVGAFAHLLGLDLPTLRRTPDEPRAESVSDRLPHPALTR